MDISTLGMAIAIAKSLPDSASGRAEAFAERAETASANAEEYGYRLTFDGSTLEIGEGE